MKIKHGAVVPQKLNVILEDDARDNLHDLWLSRQKDRVDRRAKRYIIGDAIRLLYEKEILDAKN